MNAAVNEWSSTVITGRYLTNAVPLNNANYGQDLLMSVNKVVMKSSGETIFWWGFTTQVNYKTALTNNNLVQNWLSTENQDLQVANNYLNFMCQYT